MKKIVLTIVFATVASFSGQLDTITSNSSGIGLTKLEATNDAIRNAAEQTLGAYIASQTIAENYMVVRDIITTSANAYVYSYKVLSTTFDEKTKLFSVSINAKIGKELSGAVTSRIMNSTSLNMDEIEKAKFQLSQEQLRARSALAYCASYIQSEFRNNLTFQFDSIKLGESNITTRETSVTAYFSISLGRSIASFSKRITDLSERIYEFTRHRYKPTFSVAFCASRPCADNINGWFEDTTIIYKQLFFEFEAMPISKEMASKLIQKNRAFAFENIYQGQNDENLPLTTYASPFSYGEYIGDSLYLPGLIFTHSSSETQSREVKCSTIFDAPAPEKYLKFDGVNKYTGSLNVKLPIDAISKNMLFIEYNCIIKDAPRKKTDPNDRRSFNVIKKCDNINPMLTFEKW